MHDPKLWLLIAAIYAGLLIATCIVAAVVYDLLAMHRGWPSISMAANLIAARFNAVPILLTAALFGTVGILIGHLFPP